MYKKKNLFSTKTFFKKKYTSVALRKWKKKHHLTDDS